MSEMPNVDALMAGGLSDWLESQQVVRAKAKSDWQFRLTLTGMAVVIAVLIVIIAKLSSGLGWMATAGLGAAGVAWAEAARRPVVNAIKLEMNARIAGAMGMTFSLEGSPQPSFDIATAFHLLPSHDESEWEDFWTGTLDNCDFSLCELHLQEWKQRGKSRSLETVFRGALARIDFARDFSGTTLIERQNSILEFFQGNSISRDGIDLERVRMVDPQFEDSFQVWSTDQVEARYLVHPAYCERLMALEQRFHGQKLRALFRGGAIIITIETDPLFESGSLDADKDRARMAATVEQFTTLVDLARALNERSRG